MRAQYDKRIYVLALFPGDSLKEIAVVCVSHAIERNHPTFSSLNQFSKIELVLVSVLPRASLCTTAVAIAAVI